MSMIDHDHIDRLRAQSAADLDARRYRRHTDGTIWRVHSQARSPDGPYVLAPCSLDGPTVQVSAAQLAIGFTRCDAGATKPTPGAFPTPAELQRTVEAQDATAIAALSERVRAALHKDWQPRGRVVVDVTEPPRVVAVVIARLRAQGWSVSESNSQRDGRSLTITEPSPVDPKLYR